MDYKFAKLKSIFLVLFFFNTMRSGQLLTWRDGDKVLGIALKNKVEALIYFNYQLDTNKIKFKSQLENTRLTPKPKTGPKSLTTTSVTDLSAFEDDLRLEAARSKKSKGGGFIPY